MPTNKDELINVRDKYVDSIREELLGPGSEFSYPDADHEIITESPEVRYSIGIIYPKNVKTNFNSDETIDLNDNEETVEEDTEKDFLFEGDSNIELNELDEDETDEENSLDEEIAMASQNKPASMGIIFFTKGQSDEINLKLKFGTYKKTKTEQCCLHYIRKDDEAIELPAEIKPYVVYDEEKKIFSPNLENLESCEKNFTPKYLKDLNEGNVFEWCDYLYNPLFKLATQIKNSFIRTPHEVDLKIVFDNDYSDSCKEIDGTSLKITAIRRKISEDIYVVTIMLVNDTDATGYLDLEKHVFQPQLIISTINNVFVFNDYNRTIDISKLTLEEQSIALQYRNKKQYATGMGVSVNSDVDNEGLGTISTDFFPTYEVPQMDFTISDEYEVDANCFKMKYLSDLNKEDKSIKIKSLHSIVNAYKKWIDNLNEIKNKNPELLSGIYKKATSNNIDECNKSASRMEEGLKTLEENNVAWEAFELANRAMFMQRAHLKIQDKFKNCGLDDDDFYSFLESIDYNNIDTIINDYYSWRPFQIAFLLMSINSIVFDKSNDREMVDLIWFPTGGGKTEAYLGLTAFTIFYRKLMYPNESSGTAVIMRYTLRLLTAQQFTRASTLICACEYIRRDSISKKPKYKAYPLGNEEISIGLWIGGEHTPNTISDAKSNLNKLVSDVKTHTLKSKLERYNKFQVLKCPWCGQNMIKKVANDHVVGEWGYQIKNGHFKMICPQEGCYFNTIGSLPVQIVDEELYNNPPTLLFGTVDKFAMITWNPKIGSFFGVNKKTRVPELIIQDELHLISGPLGTMVGAYETIIDTLCRNKGNSTKIIASTATIRGAKEQCLALYNREVSQFPHPGIDIEDSFFAREGKIDYENQKYGRLYVGMMASGKSKAMIEDRSIAALMERINMMKISNEIKDKFWTLTIYFNSLKELGKCSTLIEDDVIEFIGRTASRYSVWGDGRIISKPDELTSRISTTDLNETLDKLEKVEYKGKEHGLPKPSDVVLATNMISVGIDVARLNVMLMVGQPKLTSEYIQASSRIGREYPGVAFVLYDSSRSRDRSHFEQFQTYHSSFYRFVEPTGITPFSDPARERTLPSIIIALMRHLEDELKLEKNAGNFAESKYTERISQIERIIVERNKNINENLDFKLIDNSEEIINEIELIFDKWQQWAETYEDQLIYGESSLLKESVQEGQHRLLAVHGTGKDNYAFESMTSMRNVDTQLKGKILIWESDYE